MTDVFDIPNLSLHTLFHDGKSILVLSNKENIPSVYQVFLSDLESWRLITPGADRVQMGRLSHDDSMFVFPRETAGDEKHDLYITKMDSYETRLLQKLDSVMVFSTQWSPDSKNVLFGGSSDNSIGVWKYSLDEESTTSIYETNMMSTAGLANPVESVLPFIEMSSKHPQATTIKIIDYSTGEVIDDISESETSRNVSFGWDSTGTKLIVVTNSPGKSTIKIWDYKTSEVLYSRAAEMGLATNYEEIVFQPKSNALIFAAKENGRTKLFREDIFSAEEPVELPFPLGCLGGWNFDPFSSLLQINPDNPDTVYVTWSNLANPIQVGKYDLNSGKYETILDSKPGDLTIKLSPGTFHKYNTFDELEIPAYHIPPSPDAPHLDGDPIIVFIHGGPSWEIADSWVTMGQVIQAYSTAGFHVFCPNYRGSTGFGIEFSTMNIGDLGGGDMKDVVAAKEYLSKTYPESKKILLAGASYGGFITFLGLVKHPRAFDAGVAIVGTTDWVAEHRLSIQFGKSFIETFLGGTPDENPDIYYDRSPINFIENLEDPLLIIHRENDARCPIEPIYTFTGKAQALKKPVEIFVEWGAGHGEQNMDTLRKQYSLAIEFMKRHL